MHTETQTRNKTSWMLDIAHSTLAFSIKHLMISRVTGYFNIFRVAAETLSDDFTQVSNIHVEVDVASISTNNEQRDTHLRSADFFDAAIFPLITFSASAMHIDGDTGTLHGNLTIRDTTRPVTLQVELGGIITDAYGNTKAGFTVTGYISREAFGLTWNAYTEAGGIVAGDDVRIHGEIQLMRNA